MAEGDKFRVWVFGDAHVGADARHGRESLAEAIRHSEESFEWDIAIDVGDMSGERGVPTDPEGEEIVRQFGALRSHGREAIYSVAGNHDRSGPDEPEAWWWRKWIDPLGENPKHSTVDPVNRPYALSGTWERYSFQVGNVLFLMMSDVNEPTQRVGRGALGGNPGGVVRGETFSWWKEMVETHTDPIIVSVHHYMLKNTTVASGDWEGMHLDQSGQWLPFFHGYHAKGTPRGASYLYWVDSKPDSGAFETYLAQHPGANDMWLGGHTHTFPGDSDDGKGYQETRWGVHFVNCAALCRSLHLKRKDLFDAHGLRVPTPTSRLLTFTDGSDDVRLQVFLHTSDHAEWGWYPPAERRLRLARPFRWDRS